MGVSLGTLRVHDSVLGGVWLFQDSGSLSEFSEDKQTGKGERAKMLEVPGCWVGRLCLLCICSSGITVTPITAMEVGTAASLCESEPVPPTSGTSF